MLTLIVSIWALFSLARRKNLPPDIAYVNLHANKIKGALLS
jgi:hypothetical protein